MGNYLLYRLIQAIALLLPLKVSYWLGGRIADIYYLLGRKSKRAIEANLRQVLGDGCDVQGLKSCARRTFQQFAKCLIDFFRFSYLDERNICDLVTIEGRAHLDRAFAEGKGVVALSGHLGNWELGGVTLALLGYPMNAVVLSHEEREVNELFIRQRSQKGVKVIPLGAALRRCYRALRENEMVALVGDRDIGSQGVRVSFFGRVTNVPRGPAALALRTGASIVPAFVMRQKNDRFKLFLEPPIPVEVTGDNEEDIRRIARRGVEILEKYIRAYPDQWFLFYPVWPENA